MGEGTALPRAKLWPVAAAVALNLVPIVGVAFWGWSAFALVFLYWLENIAVGLRTAAGMVGAAALTGGNVAAAAAVAGFFGVHYGLFCFVHGVFVVSLFGGASAGGGLTQALMGLFSQHEGLFAGLGAIVLWQIIQLVMFLADREARSRKPFELMAAPYPRMIILHVTIIFSGMFVMMLNEPLIGLILLTLIKMGFDIAQALGVIDDNPVSRALAKRLTADQP